MAPETEQRLAAFCKAIDKLPVPVAGTPGFLVNRVLFPYMLEAVTAYAEGIPGAAIDKAAVKFGMPMGPIELIDTVGLDVASGVGDELAPFLGLPIPAALSTPPEAGKRGKKDGQGLYKWENGKAVKPELPKDYKAPSDLEDRLILPLLNEAVACLHDGVVSDADLLDAGVIFGTGFAPFRGGPIQYIRETGADALLARLKRCRRATATALRRDRLGQRRSCAPDRCRCVAIDAQRDARLGLPANAERSSRRAGHARSATLHRVRRLLRIQRAGQQRLDLALHRFALGGVGELHADAGGAVALRAHRRDPDDLAGDRQALVGFRQRQQQEHLVAQEIALGRRHEDAAVLHERHVGVVERRLVLDRQRQDALPCAACSAHATHPLLPPCARRAVAATPGQQQFDNRQIGADRGPQQVAGPVRLIEPRGQPARSRRVGQAAPASASARSAAWRRRSSRVLVGEPALRGLDHADLAAAELGQVGGTSRAGQAAVLQPLVRQAGMAARGIQRLARGRRRRGPARSQASASSRGGKRNSSRWQRLRIVAGRRAGCALTSHR